MRLPSVLRAFLAASLLFLLCCAGTEAVCRFLLHWPTPYDYPLLRNGMRFPDFAMFLVKFRAFGTPAYFSTEPVLPYPAPTVAAMKLFMIPQASLRSGAAAAGLFETSLLATAGTALLLLRRGLVRGGLAGGAANLFVACLALCSFPLWFELAQANIEWVVWLVMTVAIWAFHTRRYRLAAVCIGIAGSMKIFPIIFVGLFLPLRRIREVGLAFASAAIATLAGLWLVCPNLHTSWTETGRALGLFEHSYMVQVRPVEVGFDHSLFALVKLGLGWLLGSTVHQRGLGIYLPAVAVLGCGLFFWRIRRLPPANQVLCLTVAAVVLPPVSYEYTLLHLYAGLALLVLVALAWARAENEHAGDERAGNERAGNERAGNERAGYELPRGLLAAFLLLAFALSPQSEFISHGARFTGQLKCVALLALGYVGLRYPFRLPGGKDGGERGAPASLVAQSE